MRQLTQSKFKKGTTEYQNIASPNGEVKALKVESGQLKYSTDYSQFNEIGKVYTAGNGVSIDPNGNVIITCLSGAGAPTTSTVGALYQFYYDTTNAKLYQCTAVTAQGTQPETYSYTWGSVGVDASNFVNLDTSQQQTLTGSDDKTLIFTKNYKGLKVKNNSNNSFITLDPGKYNNEHRIYFYKDTFNNLRFGYDNSIHKYYMQFRDNTSSTTEIMLLIGNLASLYGLFPPFIQQNTYAVGDLVNYVGNAYKCTTAVTTAGAWDAANWTQVTLQDLFDEKQNTLIAYTSQEIQTLCDDVFNPAIQQVGSELIINRTNETITQSGNTLIIGENE